MTDYEPLAAHSVLGVWSAYDSNQMHTLTAIAREVGSERLVDGVMQILMRVAADGSGLSAEKVDRLQRLGARVEILTNSARSAQRFPVNSLSFAMAFAGAMRAITEDDFAAGVISLPHPSLAPAECAMAVVLILSTVGFSLRGDQSSFAPLIAELKADFWSLESERLGR